MQKKTAGEFEVVHKKHKYTSDFTTKTTKHNVLTLLHAGWLHYDWGNFRPAIYVAMSFSSSKRTQVLLRDAIRGE